MRQACELSGISRRGYVLVPKERSDADLIKRIQEIWRPNLGYRMAHAQLKDEFDSLGVKRVYRLWKAEKMGRIRRFCKKRTGSPLPFAATAPNEILCLDFCYDSCLNGTKLKILIVIDEFTRECLALEVATTFRSVNVQLVLSKLFVERGAPLYLRSDNGSEFIARSLAVFLSQSGTTSRFIKPGSPWQNGYAESFVSRLRAECLDVEVFLNLADADLKLTLFRRWYNESRPHSSLGYVPPARYAHKLQFKESLTL